MVDQLIEYGFERSLCEKHISKNIGKSIEAIMMSISDDLEQQNDLNESKNISSQQDDQESQKSDEQLDDNINHEQLDQEDDSYCDLSDHSNNTSFENELQNPCFECLKSSDYDASNENYEKNRLFDNIVEIDQMNQIGKLICFKKTNRNFSIYYARRGLLTVLEKWPLDIQNFLISKYNDQILRFFKLIFIESIFSLKIQNNQELMIRISQLLKNYFENPVTKQIIDFNDNLIDQFIFQPLNQLSKQYIQQKNQKNKQYYNGNLSNENGIDQPSLEFSLKILSIAQQSQNIDIILKITNLEIFYTIVGLVTYIRGNQDLVWEVIQFCINYVDFFEKNIEIVIQKNQQNQNIFQNSSVQRFIQYTHKSKISDKKTHSKRTQLCIEFLLFLNRLQQNIYQISQNDIKTKQINLYDQQQDYIELIKSINELSDVLNLMENYHDNQSLLQSTWIQNSDDLIQKETIHIDGEHFYSKCIHSYLIDIPYASGVTITFSEDSQFDNGDSLVISSDCNGGIYSTKCSRNLGQKKIDFASSQFYVHFPITTHDLYSWGCNKFYQCGNEDTNFSQLNYLDFDQPVSQICCGDKLTTILTQKGEVFTVGSGQNTGNSTLVNRKLTQIQFTEPVKMLSCGLNFSIFCTVSNLVYQIGSNSDGRSGLDWQSGSYKVQLVQFPQFRKIKQIACGHDHSMILTNGNTIFASGNDKKGQLGTALKQSNQTVFRQIKSKFDIKIKKIVLGNMVSFIYGKDDKQIYRLFSCGSNEYGELGQGDSNFSICDQFQEVKELKGVKIKTLACNNNHVILTSKDGVIYSWGKNDYGQLGLGHFENKGTPQKIKFFEQDYQVYSACVGQKSSTVLVKKNNETQVFQFGDFLNNQQKNNIPIQNILLENKNLVQVIGGFYHQIAISNPSKLHMLRDCHKKYNITEQGPIMVSLSLPRKIYSYKEKIQFLKEVCIYVKYSFIPINEFDWPIIDLQSQNFSQIENVNCQICYQSIKDFAYYSIHEHLDFKFDIVCDNCIKNIQNFQTLPYLYYRIPLHLGFYNQIAKQKSISRNFFFQQSETYGYNIKIQPQFNQRDQSYMINKQNYIRTAIIISYKKQINKNYYCQD